MNSSTLLWTVPQPAVATPRDFGEVARSIRRFSLSGASTIHSSCPPAQKRDNSEAEIHLLDAGHFALESQGPEIAAIIGDFLACRLR